jgi:hypothetical protein
LISTYRVWDYVVISSITALIGSIAVRTAIAIGRRQFLPDPSPQGTREAPA